MRLIWLSPFQLCKIINIKCKLNVIKFVVALKVSDLNFYPDLVSFFSVVFDGIWGNWGDWHSCFDNGVFVGFRTKVEGYQDGNDDTCMNSVEFQCSDSLVSNPVKIKKHIPSKKDS